MLRGLWRVVASVMLVMALSSCMSLKASYEIVSDERINVQLEVAMAIKAAKPASGAQTTGQQMCESEMIGTSGGELRDMKKEPFEDEKNVGCRISGWMTTKEASSGGLSITLADGVWTFRHKYPSTSPQQGDEMAKVFGEIKYQVTFPGKVLSHNGSSTVNGRTVIWTDSKELFGAEGLQATGEDSPVRFLRSMKALGIAALSAGVLFIGVGAVMVLLNRRGRAQHSRPADHDAAGQN